MYSLNGWQRHQLIDSREGSEWIELDPHLSEYLTTIIKWWKAKIPFLFLSLHGRPKKHSTRDIYFFALDSVRFGCVCWPYVHIWGSGRSVSRCVLNSKVQGSLLCSDARSPPVGDFHRHVFWIQMWTLPIFSFTLRGLKHNGPLETRVKINKPFNDCLRGHL